MRLHRTPSALLIARVSIHAPREGCDALCKCAYDWAQVSIHAPREGCDSKATGAIPKLGMFQFTHPARGATWISWMSLSYFLFQFTHPARGATPWRRYTSPYQRGFNSRTPRGVRLVALLPFGDILGVSIHAPREGCDQGCIPFAPSSDQFQFTHPARGATLKCASLSSSRFCFNSRTPRGVRQGASRKSRRAAPFQFTHPARGATVRFQQGGRPRGFQFTHPARGATSCSQLVSTPH